MTAERGSRQSASERGKQLIVLLLAFTLLAAPALAANDPGHDTLYIEESGDSELSGNLNITDELQVANLFYSQHLRIQGNGSTPAEVATRPNLYALDNNDLYLNAPGDLLLGDDAGSWVRILASAGLNVSQEIHATGDIYTAGSLVQKRVTGSCGAGEAIRAVNADGTVSCQSTSGASSGGGWTNTSTTTSTDLDVNITSRHPAAVPLTVRGTSSQSGNLQEWRDSNNNLKAAIDYEGKLTIQSSNNPNDRVLIDTDYPMVDFGRYASGAAAIRLGSAGTNYVSQIRFGYDYTGIDGTTTNEWFLTGANDNTRFSISGDGGYGTDDFLTIRQTGRVGIGTNDPNVSLHVIGQINATSDVCDETSGNCLSDISGLGGGTVGGTGTSGTLTKWDAEGDDLEDSLISESGSTVTVAGNISMPTTFFIGASASASGANAIAIGRNAVASGASSANLAFGDGAQATANNVIAIGRAATGGGGSALAIGQQATANGQDAIAIGTQASTGSSNKAIAIGEDSSASVYAIALGLEARATGTSSLAIGYNSTADETNAIALGENSNTTAANQLMVGSSGENLNTYIHGTLETTGAITANGDTVCTASNGLCTTSGDGTGGWTNSTASTNTSLDVVLESGNLAIIAETDTDNQLAIKNSSGTNKLTFSVDTSGNPTLALGATQEVTRFTMSRSGSGQPITFTTGGTDLDVTNINRFDVDGTVQADIINSNEYQVTNSYPWLKANDVGTSPRHSVVALGHTSTADISVDNNYVMKIQGGTGSLTHGNLLLESSSSQTYDILRAQNASDSARVRIDANATLWYDSSEVCTANNGLCGSGDGDVTGIDAGTGIIVNDGATATPEVAVNTTYLDANYVGQSEYPNLDTDDTDDFDGAWASLTGVPAGFSDNTDDTGGWTNTSTVTSTSLDVNITTGNLTVVAGSVGIGLTTPTYPLEVTTSSARRGLSVSNTDTSINTNYGVYATADSSTATGSYSIGVYGKGYSGNTAYGLYGVADTTGVANRGGRGVYGLATGSTAGGSRKLIGGLFVVDLASTQTGGYSKALVANLDYTNDVEHAQSFIADFQADSTSVMAIKGDGNVGIGTTLPNSSLHVIGNINATGDICDGTKCLSDAGTGSGDLTDVLAGTGIEVTDSGGPQPSVAVNTTYLDANYVGQSEYPNLDTDDTDDFDGAWASLTGVPAGFSDNTDDTGGWTNTSTVTSTRLDVNVDSGTFYVNSTENRIHLGSIPSYYASDADFVLDIQGSSTDVVTRMGNSNGDVGSKTTLLFEATGFSSANLGEAKIGMVVENNTNPTRSYGLYFTTCDQSDGCGSEKMRIAGDGNVGIATTTPTSKLEVAGNISATGKVYAEGNEVCTASNGLCSGTGVSSAGGWTNTSTLISSNTGDNISIDTDVLFVDATNNRVGIGTASPEAALQVNGSAIVGDDATMNTNKELEVISDSNTTARIVTQSLTSGETARLGFQVTTDARDVWHGGIMADRGRNLHLMTAPSISSFSWDDLETHMIILDSGEVGIGIDAPNELLHVSSADGTGDSPTIRIQNDATTLNEEARLQFTLSSTATFESAGIHAIRTNDPSTAAAELGFYTSTGTSGSGYTERLRIDGDGNVGIGTDSPDDALEVEGNFGGDGIHIDSSTGAGIMIDRGATTNSHGVVFQTAGTADYYIGNYNEADGLHIKEGDWSGSTLMTILSGGSVGIGTSSPDSLLDVAGNVTLSTSDAKLYFPNRNYPSSESAFRTGIKFATGNGYATIGANYQPSPYYNELVLSNNWDFAADDNLWVHSSAGASVIKLHSRDNSALDYRGAIEFMTSDTSQVAPSTAVFIKGDGKVGIGTSSPNGTLHVAGVINASGALHITDTGQSQIDGALSVSKDLAVGGTDLYVDVAGNQVGIGTDSPDYKLEIEDTSAPTLTIGPGTDTTVDPTLYLKDTSTTAGFKLWYDNNAGDTYFDNKYDNTAGEMIFRTRVDGTPVTAMTIGAAGNIDIGTGTAGNASSAGDLYVTSDIEYDGNLYGAGADLAEVTPASEGGLVPGTVVELDPENPEHVRKSRASYSTLVAGVVSTDPGIILGSEEEGVRLAVTGRVPVKANLENGPIAVGDLLTTSSTPGEAMACRTAEKCFGAVLGKAMEPLETSSGMITALVTIS